ncbi:hypothetical protein H0H87_001921 [Tephrocybe sp. NHM501043]|nr:hypothetical protein H0H87_001921 [Tephrocybe sp. NHM501043]
MNRHSMQMIDANFAGTTSKGEEASLMVSDFVSADFGWLSALNGIESAHVYCRQAKNRDGYFYNEDIIKQTQDAMDILTRDYPQFEHVFIFDNATAHTARADNPLSAQYMTKGSFAKFRCEVAVEIDGKRQYDADGKIIKTIPMGPK